jgi:hypothetical protein
MDIFFADPSAIPLPPEQVRIRELRAEPYPDGRRVRVTLETDPFMQRPNAELLIVNLAGDELAGTNIIESMFPRLEIVMHLRGAQPVETCRLEATLYYASQPEAPPPSPESESAPDEQRPQPPGFDRQVVDRRTTTFAAGAGQAPPDSLD